MVRFKAWRAFFFLHVEWMVLLTGLILMATLNPETASRSFCLLDVAGFSFCPGTGLGRSIALFFRGDFTASLAMHPAGIPAVVLLSGRIGSLLKERFLTTNRR
ncbi:MAG: DUF2752 domain-containing protein [Balneolaceae bacterium]